MNTLFSFEGMMLLRWTALFALGWSVHGLLRGRHARWRLVLWRGLLFGCLAVPLMQFVPVPAIRIPVRRAPDMSTQAMDISSPRVSSATPPAAGHVETQTQIRPTAATVSPPAHVFTPASTPIHWGRWLWLLWGLGVIGAALRLFRIQFQLARLRSASQLAASSVQEQAQNIRKRLDVRRTVAIRVSDSVSSSFLCGLWSPAILLPQKLARDLSQPELSALLAHEIAHVRRSDLFWCVGWQWMRALLWFHPLVWKIPAAHNLACEQEADRIASAHLEDRGLYRQLLARLALRVLALPAAETCLALNANSQIARRLNHLEQGKMGVWNWKHSAAAFAMVGSLLLVVMGCRVSAEDTATADAPNKFEFKTMLAIVQDENGQPIQGASIKANGFRVKGGHAADAYGWRKDFGPPETVITDQDGKAYLKYPVMGMPEEKEYTGALILLVSHPEFSTEHIQTFLIDGTDNPIRLTRGIPLEVSGYFGPDHQPVMDIVPSVSQEVVHPEDWQKKENGVMVFHKLSPGGHLVQLMGRLPNGEVVFSDSHFFVAESGKPCQFNLEMNLGIRLEGHIDDKIPRPVKNARVMISVRPKEYPASLEIEDFYNLDDKYGHRYFWHSYRPIAEDGSFVFESIPPGGVDITVLGDGFISKSIGQLHNRLQNGTLDTKPTIMVVPQAFQLEAPVTKVEVTTEPTATLDITTTTTDGKAIEGVYAGLYPSAFRMRGMLGWLTNSSEEPFRQVPQLPGLSFSGKTDENGKLVLRNVPAEERIMSVENERYRLPINDKDNRAVYLHLNPGETNVFDLKVEPVATDFRGAR